MCHADLIKYSKVLWATYRVLMNVYILLWWLSVDEQGADEHVKAIKVVWCAWLSVYVLTYSMCACKPVFSAPPNMSHIL